MMFCPNCRANLPDDAKGCPHCGAWFGQAQNQQSQQQGPGYAGQQGYGYQQNPYMGQGYGPQYGGFPPIIPFDNRSCGKATASFVVALISLFLVSLAGGIVGIILGAIALGECSRNPYLRGKGLAIAGLVLSILSILLWIVVIATTVALYL